MNKYAIRNNLASAGFMALMLAFVAVAMIASSPGCAAAKPIHPGAVNQFDSTAYDSLITVQAALTTAKGQIAAFPQFKPQLNQAIAAYNTAQAAYKVYHTAALAGDTSQQAALSAEITTLTQQVAQLLTSMGVTP